MFTGLSEKIAKVINIILSSNGAKICVQNHFSDVELGESIAINGVCTTVSAFNEKELFFDIMPQTLKLTNLGNLKKGEIVNLERAMLANSRFGGHIVSGHIDTVAKLYSIKDLGNSKAYRFLCDTKYIIPQGSICINGISLTVVECGDDYFEVNLIPHTLEVTNLSYLKTGDFANIEFDIFAKYIEKFVGNAKKTKIDENFLRENGF